MVSFGVAGVVAAILVALLAVAIGMSGGWRRTRPGNRPGTKPGTRPGSKTASDHVSPQVAVPYVIPAPLTALGRRIQLNSMIFRGAFLVALGLTPLGARFVHLLAPEGTHWRVAAAMLVIVVLAEGTPLPVSRWWLGQLRAASPALVRPLGPRRLRLLRLAFLACWFGIMLFALAALTGLAANVTTSIELVFAVAAFVLARLISKDRSAVPPPPPRLVTALESLPKLPDERTVRVSARWARPIANAAAVSGRGGRRLIVVAPPLLDALTDEQLRAVLAHELAHLRNHDTQWRRLRRLLMLLASAAIAATLYGISALRHMAGLQETNSVTGQSLPLLLAVGYLAYKLLRTAHLRACRAEEATADQQAVELTGDRQACVEGINILGSMLGSPAVWSLPQRLLIATHPAMGERLSESKEVQLKQTARQRYQPASIVIMVIALAAGSLGLYKTFGPVLPANAGWYRVIPPTRFASGTAEGPAQLGVSVWNSGITRFPGAVPVGTVYDRNGQPWLYVWGAEGDLADPAGELAAYWNANGQLGTLAGLASQAPVSEPTGPLGGYLQCWPGQDTCAWADYSGIVVVSTSQPVDTEALVTITTENPDQAESYTNQAFLKLTSSFRGMAEQLRPGARTAEFVTAGASIANPARSYRGQRG